jgi:hypothetical protein
LAAAGVFVLTSACDVSFKFVKNCPLDSYNQGEQRFLLEYELEIPQNCPVPQGQSGEAKVAAAFIYDYGYKDFTYGHVVIRNKDLQYVLNRVHYFSFEGTDRYGNSVHRHTAFPQARYPASTAGYLTTDFGDFIASNSPSFLGNPGDPFGRVKITYEPSDMMVAVQGNSIPLSNQSTTWTASVTGGVAPHSYAWYRDGAYMGAASVYTGSGTRDFILRAQVTDAAQATRAAVFSVDVDGVIASVDGATLVYASQPLQTWTAAGQGGYPPYTFNWHLDGNWVGQGATWSGYPGEGHHVLRADMADTHGTTNSASLGVTGIGNETCEPVPPAVTC